MKKILSLLALLLALVMAATACSTPVADPAQDVPAAAEAALTKDLVILFTSDVHCGVDQGWGVDGLASLRDNIGKDNHVVLVDNGDFIQGEPIGTMTDGKALVELMNAVGYDVATPGNHEFDYGMDNFLTLANEVATFPYISANFTKEGKTVFDPYIIKEFDGVKVAFVGISTPKTITSSTPTYFQDENGNYIYSFCQDTTGEGVYTAVQTAVDAARGEGAKYVVAMGHLGNEAECSPWTSAEVIQNTTGIDILLDGHAHETNEGNLVKNKEDKDVLRVACGTKLANIGYVTIGVDGKLTSGNYVANGDVVAALDDATAALEETLKTVVAKSEVPLYIYDPVAVTDDGAPVRIIRNAETNLGDLCADAYRILSGADVGFVNGGGIRVQIDAGDITLNDILLVHPFGNAMCVVEVTGQQILDALEWGAHVFPGQNGGWLQVSGLTYELHSYIESSVTQDENGMFTGVAGEYRVKNVKVGGEDLDLTKVYTLASHNYMLKSAGDGFSMFVGTKVLQDEVMLDNQVLITYITDVLGGVVGEAYANPYGEGRIVGVEEKPAE